VLARGVAASPGAALGEIVFSTEAAVEAAREGRDVILVRRFTEADDVAGVHAARGILTSEGGKASHAALVARAMGVPAVTGAAVVVDSAAPTLRVNGHVLGAGDRIGIDGSAGAVVSDSARLIDADANPYFERILEWADDVRKLGVRANADTPRMPHGRVHSAPRGSACAAQSTCSWPRTAGPRCER
jgi:pyruvate, orthophosphate dikinase